LAGRGYELFTFPFRKVNYFIDVVGLPQVDFFFYVQSNFAIDGQFGIYVNYACY